MYATINVTTDQVRALRARGDWYAVFLSGNDVVIDNARAGKERGLTEIAAHAGLASLTGRRRSSGLTIVTDDNLAEDLIDIANSYVHERDIEALDSRVASITDALTCPDIELDGRDPDHSVLRTITYYRMISIPDARVTVEDNLIRLGAGPRCGMSAPQASSTSAGPSAADSRCGGPARIS